MAAPLISDDAIVDLLERVRSEPEFVAWLRDEHPELFNNLGVLARRVRTQFSTAAWRGGLARPQQLLPGTPGSFSDRDDWRTFLMCGGRGSGKSRSAAEGVKEVLFGRAWVDRPRVALVSTTLDAVRIDMVEGALLDVLGPEVERYNRSQVEIYVRPSEMLPKGAYLKGYGSERPRRLRGPNFHLAWADEIAAWMDSTKAPSEDSTWSNLEFATRLTDRNGWSPRIIASTTPRPCRLMRIRDVNDDHYPGVIDDPMTVVANLRTMDNIDNLADVFRRRVVGRFQGTRLGAQELDGRLLDVAEHALFDPDDIARHRVALYDMLTPGRIGQRIIAVDPTTGDGSGDECGIVVAGTIINRFNQVTGCVILDDQTLRGKPKVWAKKVADVYEFWDCSYVVAEISGGHQLILDNLGREAPNLPVRSVKAKDGKAARAEPVSLLFDQGKVKFAGQFPLLEDQMCTYEVDAGLPSPDRLDAFVYAVLELLPARWSGSTQTATAGSGFHDDR